MDEAVEYCRTHGVEFYAVNKSYPEEVMDENTSRKIMADIYIDDRNLGGFPGWSVVWQLINPDPSKETQSFNYKKGKGFLKKFLNLE